MTEVKHTPWEVGQHPAIPNGWIVRPILMGPNVRVLPKSEGGHVMLMDEAVAHKIAAAPEMLEALPDLFHVITWLENGCDPAMAVVELRIYQERIDAAKAKAKGLTP